MPLGSVLFAAFFEKPALPPLCACTRDPSHRGNRSPRTPLRRPCRGRSRLGKVHCRTPSLMQSSPPGPHFPHTPGGSSPARGRGSWGQHLPRNVGSLYKGIVARLLASNYPPASNPTAGSSIRILLPHPHRVLSFQYRRPSNHIYTEIIHFSL